MSSQDLTNKIREAQDLESQKQIQQAKQLYEQVITHPLQVPDDVTEENTKAKETACYKLAAILREQGNMTELIKLQKTILPLFADLPKSKTGKIIRTLFDISTKMEGRFQDLVDLSKVIIEWCEKESRSFLRMRIENKLADLYFKLEKYQQALEILKKLLAELKKKEDKQLMVEAQLVESKVYHALENLPKAKAALTSVKTAANTIYVVPLLQAEIDMMSGLIACDEKDYTTAYSYFYETFEGYRSMNEQQLAANAFKFMTFSKIMNRQSQDCLNLIASSMALKFQNRHTDAMREVAKANKDQNLLAFEQIKQQYQKELVEDNVIRKHFGYLYNNLLEDNLQKIILPYSEVQIDYVAERIGLPVDRILQKLSEMILDEKIQGTLDQGRNCLIIFEETESSELFKHTEETFTNLDSVLDSLYDKTQKYKEKYHS